MATTDALAAAANNLEESRMVALMRARRGGRGFSETGEPAQAGPSPIDLDSRVRRVPFVRGAAERLHDRGIMNVVDTPNRFLDAESAQARREDMAAEARQEREALKTAAGGVFGGGAPAAKAQAVDQAVARESREQRLGSRLQTARSPSRRDQAAEGGGQGGGGLSLGGLASLAAGNKAAGAGLTGALGSGSAAGGIKKMKQQLGAGIIKSCWANLLDSFGHTIWIIDIMFLLGWASSFLREYIPEVGMEWLPQQTRDLLPRSAVLPLKLAELVAMMFISFFIGILDICILSMIILIISVLMAVGAGVAKVL